MGDTSKLISASECDRLFRLRKTTAANAARAGVVRHTQRPGRGRYGYVILIDSKDAERVWGAK
jgi:hypothetical protein